MFWQPKSQNFPAFFFKEKNTLPRIKNFQIKFDTSKNDFYYVIIKTYVE
jgi:hypothetical protein